MSLLYIISSISQTSLLWIAGILGIGFLIGIHEFGHFLFCKLFKIRTPSFSIGFGPKIFEKQIGETLFKISAIPFGGYVEIAGSAEVGQGEQKEAYAKDEYSMAVKPYWQKMLVMAGGILVNTFFAYLTFIALFFSGAPKTLFLYPLNAIPQIERIIPNSPATKFDLKAGDVITKVNQKPLSSVEELINQIKNSPGKSLELTIYRNNNEQSIQTTIGTQAGTNYGTLGLIFSISKLPGLSLISAIKTGIKATHQSIFQIIFTLKYIFSKRSLESVGGPLMIIAESIKGARQGMKVFFALLAFISINLAVINLLPLPITDGGQALFYTIEAIIHRELPEKTKLIIHYISWIGVLLLFVYLSIKDIWHLIYQWL